MLGLVSIQYGYQGPNLATVRDTRWKLHVPLGVARLQAAFLEFIFSVAGKPSPLSRDQLLMLQEDNVGDTITANELFKLKPIGFKTGIRSYLAKREYEVTL